jgi:hypothetical protein
VVVTYSQKGDAGLVAIAVDVPLVRHAIRLFGTARAADEAQIAADVLGVLAAIEGESSWVRKEEPGERLGRVVGLLVVAIPLAIWTAVWIRRRRQRTT